MINPAPTIREATEADLPAILDLYSQAGLDEGVRVPLEKAQAQFARLAAYPSHSIYVVTDNGGSVLATYALLIMDNIAHAGAPLAIVEHVAVAASHQSRGIGTAMMRHAMDLSRAAGCYKLALSSHVKRERAHDFYDKLGFTRHGYSFEIDPGA